MKILLLAAALVALPAVGDSRWGPGGCAAPGLVSPKAKVIVKDKICPCHPSENCTCGKGLACDCEHYEWRDGSETQAWLFRNGRCVGQWYYPESRYYPWDGRKDGEPQVNPPAKAPIVPPKVNFGVIVEKIPPGPRYVTKDGEVDHDTAEALIAGQLEDQTKRLRVTVIGADADRASMTKALRSPPPDLVGSYLLNDFAPAAWQVTGSGFKTAGNPVVVYCQAADGKVLHRQDDQDGGPEAVFKAIRKARPDYDPTKDPDLRKPASPTPSPGDVPPVIWVAGAVGGLYLLSKRKQP